MTAASPIIQSSRPRTPHTLPGGSPASSRSAAHGESSLGRRGMRGGQRAPLGVPIWPIGSRGGMRLLELEAMVGSGRVPSLGWLVGGGVAGVLVGGALFLGLRYYAASVATTVSDLRTANDVIGWIGVGAALSMLALGVLIDAELFQRRGHPVGGITGGGSWLQRIVAILIWPALVGGFLIFAMPTYGYFRAKAAGRLRGPGEPTRSPVIALAVTLVATLAWVGIIVGVYAGGPSRLPVVAYVADDSTDQEATAWATTQGHDLDVTCSRVQVLRVGDSFTCYGFIASSEEPVVIVGTLLDGSGHAQWRFAN
jgi:hypothetical protein